MTYSYDDDDDDILMMMSCVDRLYIWIWIFIYYSQVNQPIVCCVLFVIIILNHSILMFFKTFIEDDYLFYFFFWIQFSGHFNENLFFRVTKYFCIVIWDTKIMSGLLLINIWFFFTQQNLFFSNESDYMNMLI